MKAFYLVSSVVFTVLILILAFENIDAQCGELKFFFYPIEHGPTIVFLGISVIGIITGVLYHALLSRLLATTEEEEDEKF